MAKTKHKQNKQRQRERDKVRDGVVVHADRTLILCLPIHLVEIDLVSSMGNVVYGVCVCVCLCVIGMKPKNLPNQTKKRRGMGKRVPSHSSDHIKCEPERYPMHAITNRVYVIMYTRRDHL